MKPAPSSSFPDGSPVAPGQGRARDLKFPARTARDHATSSRRWFAALLWSAFPAPSERDLSIRASRVLDVSPRQVVNWLRCEHDASLRYVTAVMAIAGCEVIFGRIEGRK